MLIDFLCFCPSTNIYKRTKKSFCSSQEMQTIIIVMEIVLCCCCCCPGQWDGARNSLEECQHLLTEAMTSKSQAEGQVAALQLQIASLKSDKEEVRDHRKGHLAPQSVCLSVYLYVSQS